MRTTPWSRRAALVCAAALAALATVATASDHREPRHERRSERERGRGGDAGRATPADPQGLALYRKECGSCHLAFPPGLLPAASHRRLMGALDRHFGQDAELDPAVRDRLEAWLVANAAESGSDAHSRKVLAASHGGDAPARLTDSPWFRRKHREVEPQVLSRPAIRTWANCGACHGGAASWDFSEDRVRIPARSP